MVGSVNKEFKRWKVQFRRELIVAIFILVLPLFIYSHLIFSESSQDLDFFFWRWWHGFKNNQLFIWNILSDLIPLCLLIIAFVSTASYLRYFLIPFIITFFFFLLSDLFYLNPAHFFSRIEGYFFAILIFFSIWKLDNLILRRIRSNLLTFSTNDVFRELVALKYSKIIENIEKTTRKSNEITGIQYVSRLHFYRELIQKAIGQNEASDKPISKWLDAKLRRLLIINSLIVSLVLNFVYLAIPEELNRIEIGLLAINDLGFGSLSNLAWYALKKVSLLIVLTVWFSISKNWWKIAILSPLMIYSFQLIEVFYEVENLESYLNTSVFSLIIFISLAILILSRIVRLKSKMMDYLDLTQSELNKEMARLSKLNY